MKLWSSALLVVAIGCGGASKPAPEDVPLGVEDAGPSEGDGSDAAVAPVDAGPPVAPKGPAKSYTCAEAEANVAALTQHVSLTLAMKIGARCASDRWAQEVVNCFAATPRGPDLGLCTALLTPEQQRALERQDVSDAIDPNAPPDPACAVLTGAAPVPAPTSPTSPTSPPSPTSPTSGPGSAAGAKPVPLPTLGLPRGGAGKKPAQEPAAPAGEAPAVGVGAVRTIPAKELEQLRISGETQLGPDAAEQQLMARCRVPRVLASIKLCLNDTGAIALVDPLRSSRLPGYDAKLVATMRTWRYRPYLFEGKATAVCSAITFVYALK